MALTSPGVIKTTNEVLVALAPELTMVKQFSYDISDTVADYGAKVRIPMITAGSAKQYADDNCSDTGNGNYEFPTGSLSDVFVTLSSQPKATIPITATDKLELPNDSFWTRAAEAGRNTIGAAISDTVGALFTTENCTGGKLVISASDITNEKVKAKVAGLRASASAKGRVGDYVVLLDPVYFAELVNELPANVYGDAEVIRTGVIPALFGFKAVIQAMGLPDGIKGALVPADGVAIAVRPVAIPDPTAYPECGVVTDENGFSLTAMRHTSFATAKAFYNVTALVGADIIRKAETFYIAQS